VAIGGYAFSSEVPMKLIMPNTFYITPGNPDLSYPNQNSIDKGERLGEAAALGRYLG